MNGKNIAFISVLYLVVWCISPPLSYGTIYRLLAILSIASVIIFSASKNLTRLTNRLKIGMGLCAYMILVCLLTGESYTWKIATFILILISTSFALWNFKFGNDSNRLKLIILTAILLYCVWNTTALLAIQNNAHIMRDLVRNSEFSEYYARQGVGGYGYLYSNVIMLPIGISSFIRNRNLMIRLICAYYIASSVTLIYLSQYFIALIIMVLIIPGMYIAQRNSRGMSPLTYVIMILFIVIIFSNLEFILNFFISIVDIPSINKKLIGMQASLLYGGDIEESEFGTRYERYMRDLIAIFSSPIFGVLKYSLVGKHSNILDFFAQYGIPLGIVYVKILFAPCRDWIKKGDSIASVVMWVALIIAIMNQMPPSAAIPMCVVMPAFCKLTCQESR